MKSYSVFCLCVVKLFTLHLKMQYFFNSKCCLQSLSAGPGPACFAAAAAAALSGALGIQEKKTRHTHRLMIAEKDAILQGIGGRVDFLCSTK